ncbi:MAG TPA: TonB-dependent receptor, partial [bacterium]|nr:TonB-dependent receptor [bacterium]
IPEALRLADNLDVAQKGSHDWAISSRGFDTDSANKLLVLMDGRSVYTPLFSGVFWDVQDYLLEDVDRVEVISGPGGTLWGANAVNGVINITTKDARDTQGTYWEASGGSRFQDSLAARYGGRADSGLYYRVYGKYFALGNEDLASGGEASDAWNHKQGGFRMDGEAGEDHFTLQGDLYGTTANLSSGGTAESDGGNLLGRWTKTFAADDDMGLQAYYDRTYLYDPVPASVSSGGATLAPAGTLTDNLTTLDLDFHHRFALTRAQELTWGLGVRYTHDTVTDAPGLAFDPSTLDQGLFSAFAQDEIGLWKDLTLTAGTKLEHNDYTGFEWEPSARLKWKLDGGQMLWTAVSRAVRAPSRVDRDILLPTPNFSPIVDDLLVGGKDFRSETLVAYELGYRAQAAPDLAASASAFFNNYDDIRSTSLSPPNAYSLPFPLYYANNLAAQTWGLELTADWQAAPGWRLHGGYDLLQESVWVKPGQFDYNNALNETA